MRRYEVQDGDTFDRVSTIAYGSPSQAQTIKEANPQAEGGLVTGMILNVPDAPGIDSFTRRVAAARENEVSITLGGHRFRFWTTMRLNKAMDRFDTFELSAPFEPDNDLFRLVFQPFTFLEAVLFIGGDQRYTGVNVNTAARVGIDGNVVTSSGYSLPGVWNDCTMPGSSFPLEYDGMNLQQIATALARPFGLTPSFTADAGPTFDRVALEHTTKVLSFLKKLAQQRKLVISNDRFGRPVFQQETDAAPIQTLEQGQSPVREITPTFDPQEYFSHVTAITPAYTGVEGSQYTATNPFLRGVLRPIAFDAPDTFGADAKSTAEAKLGRMFANSLSYKIDLAGWRDANGNEWEPNTKVKLLAPGAMVYTATEFLIREVELERNASEDISTLTLVLPGAFSGKAPEALPWGA